MKYMSDVKPDESARMERARVSFFSSGMQYYISGRYAVRAGLVPVAGNILHHAIEMFLKGGLASVATLKELKEFKHKVPKIWRRFKEQIGSTELDRFDAVITSIDAFERIRYPNSLIENGARIMAGVVGTRQLPKVKQIIPTPSYELYLSDIDPLVRAIFEAASVNPRFFLGGLNTHAREYFNEGNLPTW